MKYKALEPVINCLSLSHGEVFAEKTLAPISHQHSSRFGQTVFPDVEETEEGRVKLTLPRMTLKGWEYRWPKRPNGW